MSLFDIRPWIVKKKDGTKKQVMPQTTIRGVIGLEKELTSIKSVVKNLTGKNLENYVTTHQGAAGPQGPKGDTGPAGPQGPKGGRNLLLDTGKSFTCVGHNQDNELSKGYSLAGGKKLSDLCKQYGPSGHLTLSFDWAASGDTISGKFIPQWNDTPWSGLANSGDIKPSSTNKSGHYQSTVQLNSDGYSTGVATGVEFRLNFLQGNLTISNMKLEAGNLATDWTPAPEDTSYTATTMSPEEISNNTSLIDV